MLENPETIRILDLTKLDAHELKEELGENIQIQPEQLPPNTFGEPLTFFAVLVLGPLTIKAISLWLMKRRTKGNVRFTYEIMNKDGIIERRTVEIIKTSSSPPKAEIIEQVCKEFKVDESVINAAMSLI